jgi:Tol biopolymer transport system component
MAISAGSRLGPYEVLSPLGAGGMGEVWRARDSRLGRDVALKVLPEEVATDSSRLHRFEKEARSASALNHPNIVTVYEIGSEGSVSFIAMELVEGKTIRELLFAGALPLRRLLQIGAQVAEGLARAHEAGIVHRDLKPENLMVTKDGLVKILDFGLAKLTRTGSGSDEASQLPTETGTTPGAVIGTVGYMSPEQASARPVDFRSDQFSFGSILYEMATGRRAFQKKTAVETLSAILNEEPEPVGAISPQAPTPLRWIVERCLAKEPEDRYAASRDLARDLVTLRDRLPDTVSGAALAAGPRRRSGLWLAAAAVLLVTATLFAGRALWKTAPPAPPKFQRLTFRRGSVDEARFSPDGQTVLYSARWDGEPPRIFLTRTEDPASQLLGLPEAYLLSVSRQGELAIVTGKAQIGTPWGYADGTLATVAIVGGTPRELATEISLADWAPDGRQMAVIRNNHLEFPLGKTIYTATEPIAFPRVSPSGDRIALQEGRHVRVVDLSGKTILASREWGAYPFPAWSPSGKEVWTSAGNTLYELNLAGEERVLFRGPGGMQIKDVSRDGRVLLNVGHGRMEVWSRPAGQTRERDLSVLGASDAMGISPDGKTLLINENPGDPNATFYLRYAEGSPPKKLGEGYAAELSPDGKWVVVARAGPPAALVLVPTGAGEARTLPAGNIEWYEREDVRWSQDGRWLLFGARARGEKGRMYLQEVAGGDPRPLTPDGEYTGSSGISPDGRSAVIEMKGGFWLYPADGGKRRLVPGLGGFQGQVWRNWSEDGRFIYVWNNMELPFRVSRVEVSTGRRDPWLTVAPQDPAGIWNADLMLTPDGKSYAYNCRRALHELFLVEGLK